MMPKLNNIYISARLSEKLSRIPQHPITTIIAPMGYGKTTAVTWWADRHAKACPRQVILRQMIDTDSLTDFWNGLCRTLRAHTMLCEQLSALGFPQDAQAMSMMAELIEDAMDSVSGPVFYILDDLHIIQNKLLVTLLQYLSRRLGERLRLVLLSRGSVFSDGDKLRLGAKLQELSADDLRMNRQEIAHYARRCGLSPTEGELDDLASSSEGWISMVYLNLKAYAQTGAWLESSGDIFNVIDQVLLSPLTERQRLFLMLVSVADSFTAEKAAWLWGQPDAAELLESLTRNNAFITKGEQGVYRYHHMLRKCARKKFSQLPQDRQASAHVRLGDWHKAQREFVEAECAYSRAGAWDKLLDALGEDCGKSLCGEYAQTLYEWSVNCPVSILSAHPDAVLVLMRKLFSFRRVPDMFRLKELLLTSLEQNDALTYREKQDYLGECELVMSFLEYNDISAMSAHHRRACAMMSRFSRCIDPRGTWTFGAPSILMAYHRTSGGLDLENSEMRECMPYYYQVADNHGNGAEYVMQGETEFMRNKLIDADLSYHFASSAASRKEQYSISVTAEFLAMRMALLEGDGQKLTDIIQKQRALLRKEKQYILLNTLDMCEVWVLSVLDHTDDAPAWIAAGAPSSAVMYPATPMLQTVYNQYLLSRQRWAEVVTRREECAALYENSHALLCAIHLHIQLSAALDQLGKRPLAMKELKAALDLALPDGIVMPFAENCDYITIQLRELSKRGIYREEIGDILTLAERYRESKRKIRRELWGEDEDYGLTARELEIAGMAAERKTNKEIAERLHLADGTVRNQLSRIFDKLDISGDSKNKRLELERLFRREKQ